MRKEIGLLIPKGPNSPIALATASGIFSLAQELGLKLSFHLVSTDQSRKIHMAPFQLEADQSLSNLKRMDMVIIPSLPGNPNIYLSKNKELIQWLVQAYRAGTQIISLCTGAYLLAASGLLDGKIASSHFNAIRDLKQRFPKVDWQADKIITDQDNILTSGGSLSSLNVLIYWLGKNFDREKAFKIAKFIQIDYPRISQKPFFVFSNQRQHNDDRILKVQDYLEQNLVQMINLDVVARKFGISRRSLNRRFKEATGESPKSYWQRARIEHAKQLLEKENISIKELSYRMGYQDEKAFRHLFKKISGLLPSEYAKKFSHY